MEKVYRTVIIDDEESAIDNLCFELQRYTYIYIDRGKSAKWNFWDKDDREVTARSCFFGCGVTRYARYGCSV